MIVRAYTDNGLIEFEGVVVDSVGTYRGMIALETYGNDTITYIPNVLWLTTDHEDADL